MCRCSWSATSQELEFGVGVGMNARAACERLERIREEKCAVTDTDRKTDRHTKTQRHKDTHTHAIVFVFVFDWLKSFGPELRTKNGDLVTSYASAAKLHCHWRKSGLLHTQAHTEVARERERGPRKHTKKESTATTTHNTAH